MSIGWFQECKVNVPMLYTHNKHVYYRQVLLYMADRCRPICLFK